MFPQDLKILVDPNPHVPPKTMLQFLAQQNYGGFSAVEYCTNSHTGNFCVY